MERKKVNLFHADRVARDSSRQRDARRHVATRDTSTRLLEETSTSRGEARLPQCHSSSSRSIKLQFHWLPHRRHRSTNGRRRRPQVGVPPVLLSRRGEPQVPLTVEQGTPVTKPLFQGDWPLGPREAMESCPRKDVKDFYAKLVEENFFLITESGKQGRVPVLLLKLNDAAPERKPVVVILHSSYKCKEWVRPLLEAYASRGYIAVSIDSRYHGERASGKNTYTDALKAAWRNGDTMPFIFDTAWDLIKLADHLSERKDVDPSRIGITGESLGGMHSWFAAFVDSRYSVVVPIVGFQGFRWAIDNNMWEARVNSIRPVFEEAATDLGKSEIDSEVVEKVWDRIAPGLVSRFDAPYSVPLIAPRPLLLLNGAEDPCCPIAGLQEPASRVAEAYEKAGSADKFKFIVEPGVEHMLTVNMVKETSDWFDRFLQ